jgi:hypothetical protein
VDGRSVSDDAQAWTAKTVNSDQKLEVVHFIVFVL